MIKQQKSRKIGYEWVIAIACFLMVFISLGFASSTKGTYLKAICDDLNLERSTFSFNTSAQYLVSAVLNFFFGVLIFKLGPRKMITLGYICYTAAFLVQAYATEMWHFSLSCILQGAGNCWSTTSVVAFLVEKWFTNNKGTITGVILAANGFGGAVSEMIITPIAFNSNSQHGFFALTEKIGKIINMSGWRLASFLTAILYVIIGILLVSLIRNQPKDAVACDFKSAEKAESDSIIPMLRKTYFYIGAVAVFLIAGVLQSIYSIAKVHILDRQVPVNYVIAVFGINSILLALAKILSGFLFDKFGIKFTFLLEGICAVVSIISLVFVTKEFAALSWVYCIIGAIGIPLQTVMIPLFVSAIFDKIYYTKIVGYYLALAMLGYTVFIPIINLCQDIYHTYDGGIIIYAVLMTLSIVLSFIAIHLSEKDRKKENDL